MHELPGGRYRLQWLRSGLPLRAAAKDIYIIDRRATYYGPPRRLPQCKSRALSFRRPSAVRTHPSMVAEDETPLGPGGEAGGEAEATPSRARAAEDEATLPLLPAPEDEATLALLRSNSMKLRLPGFSANPISFRASYWNLRRTMRLLWAFVIISVLVTLTGARGSRRRPAARAEGDCAPPRTPASRARPSPRRRAGRQSQVGEQPGADSGRVRAGQHIHDAHGCAGRALAVGTWPRVAPPARAGWLPRAPAAVLRYARRSDADVALTEAQCRLPSTASTCISTTGPSRTSSATSCASSGWCPSTR